VLAVETSAVLERPPEDVAGDVLPTSYADPTDAETSDRVKVTIEDRAERLWLVRRSFDDLRIVHSHQYYLAAAPKSVRERGNARFGARRGQFDGMVGARLPPGW
jgi:hypothetical protein